MKKRRIALAAAAALILTAFPAGAKEQIVDEMPGKALCLIEAQSGTVLMAKGEKERFDAAGLSRLPALLVACEAIDEGEISIEDIVSVSEAAADVRGPTAFLSGGERMAVGELIKSAVMITAGDAVFAATEAVDASDKAFVERVDRRLKELKIEASYTDRLGANMLFSVEELALIGAALCRSNTFLSYSKMYYEELVHESGLVTEMASANKLLKTCEGTNGVATGSSSQAGYCGVFSAKRGDDIYVCSILGAENAAERAKSAKAMLEYAFSSYNSKMLAKRGETLQAGVKVIGGVSDKCDLVAARDVFVVLPKDNAYTERREIPENLQAPLRAGEALGSIVYLDANGETLSRVELTVAEDVEEALWQDYFIRFLLRHLYI